MPTVFASFLTYLHWYVKKKIAYTSYKLSTGKSQGKSIVPKFPRHIVLVCSVVWGLALVQWQLSEEHGALF
jgi:hypothetical protein